MKLLFYLLLLLPTLPLTGNAQNKEQLFEETVYTLIDAFAKRDKETIGSYINNDIKLATIYRMGAANNFSFLDEPDLDPETTNPLMNYRPINVPESDYKIEYGKSAMYSCDTEEWNLPPGLYCNKNTVDRVFTSAIRLYIDYDMKYNDSEYHISEKEYQAYKDLENKSRKIYLILEDGDDLVFSLSWINNKWYLTILDRVAGDCSA